MPSSRSEDLKIALSPEFLSDIVQNKMQDLSLVDRTFVAPLEHGDRIALKHLVKAAAILDQVFLKQDHPNNLRARSFLQKRAASGDQTARDALTLFTSFNGAVGYDRYAPQTVPLSLFKNVEYLPGRNFFPRDLSAKELADYTVQHPEEASALFGNNTVVRRKGRHLIAEPYSVVFRKEMTSAAREILAAARTTSHEGFRDYLRWQAQALVNDSDPEVLFRADCAWIKLEDSPLEFTISRECYEEELSPSILTDPLVKAALEENGIKAKAKDFLGVRVGIVNKESFERIALYRRHQKDFAAHMPLADQYALKDDALDNAPMSLVDVDLVALSGDYASTRLGIITAQNLPNSDKLVSSLNQGSRLVFHRQVRQASDPSFEKRFLEALVDPSQRSFYDTDSIFPFVVGHELGHSLGPKVTRDGRDKKAVLGETGSILEENKADLASILMTERLFSLGAFSWEQTCKLYLTWMAKGLPNNRPSTGNAHRMREIMQINYFREKGAVLFEKGSKLKIIFEKMAPTANQMLTEVIGLQLNGDFSQAQPFVERYAAWNEALQYATEEQMKLKPKLYRRIHQPLRDELLKLRSHGL